MAKRIYMRRSAAAEKNRILTQLQNEGDRLVQQLHDQFARELAKQMAQVSSAGNGSGGGGDSSAVSNYTALFSSAMRYLLRPQAKTNMQETSRSREALQQFRLSQSQAAAEAQATLTRGQKNE